MGCHHRWHAQRPAPPPVPAPRAYAYAYDTAGRLASVTLNGVVQASYTYDWKGQQAVRRFPASGPAIQSVFDSAGHRIAEYNEGTGALIRAYVWLGDMSVGLVDCCLTPFRLNPRPGLYRYAPFWPSLAARPPRRPGVAGGASPASSTVDIG